MNNTTESNSRGCIYRINFGNGQYYIGQTMRSLQERYHNDVAKHGSNEHVRHAAATYGYDIEVLGYYNTVEALNEVEELAVDMCMDDPNCLNVIRGGGNSGGNGTEVILISPEGTVHKFKTQSVAARYIGVTSSKISALMSGKRNHTHGWRMAGLYDQLLVAYGGDPNTYKNVVVKVAKERKQKAVTTNRSITLISPEGESVTFNSHTEALNRIGSKSASAINRLMQGTTNHVKGWTYEGPLVAPKGKRKMKRKKGWSPK